MSKIGVIFALVRDNKVLMQQRDAHSKTYPFSWCIPGGGSDDGEDYTDTLIREVTEEYSIDLTLDQCSFLMDYDNGRANKVYVCRINPNQEPILHEGLAMKWMSIEEVEALELGFNQKGIVPVLKKALAAVF